MKKIKSLKELAKKATPPIKTIAWNGKFNRDDPDQMITLAFWMNMLAGIGLISNLQVIDGQPGVIVTVPQQAVLLWLVDALDQLLIGGRVQNENGTVLREGESPAQAAERLVKKHMEGGNN